MRGAPHTMLVAISVLATACSGGGLWPTDSASSAPTTDEALVMTSTPETDAAVAGMVTLEEGGAVEAEAADGTTFELAVPPGAVAEDTEITLRPLEGVGGLGTDGPVHAVQLEPDGLELFALARLTITPAEPIPIEEQLAFEAAGDGSDVQLALIDPTSEPMVLLLEHFSSGGMGGFSAEQQATFLAKSATNAERRISGEIRARIAGERQRQLTGESEGQPDISDLIDEFKREVVDRRRDAAALSCNHLYAYVKTLISFERQLQLLGTSEEETDASYAATMDEVRRILDERYPECEREKIAECQEEEDPAILIRFWLANREVGRSGQPEVTRAEEERAEQLCKPQGLMFEMSGSRSVTAGGTTTEVVWEFWGLKCEGTEEWMIWETVAIEGGPSTSTGAPGEDPYGPVFATFGEDGVVEDGARWPGAGESDPLSQSPPGWGTLTGTIFTLVPADDPTDVTATIRQGGLTDTAPVEPWDGSFGECPEADAS